MTVHVGHDAAHVGEVDAVAVSTAMPPTQPRGARRRRSGASRCCAGPRSWPPSPRPRRTIAVSGTHGKTTTSSMLALVLVEAGLRPSFIVGGEVNEIGGGAVWADGEWFVVEADESDGTFVELGADIAVVTNVEADHLDHYGDLAGVEAAFDRFVGRGARPDLVCADDPGAAAPRRPPRRAHLRHRRRRRLPIVDPSTGRSGTLVRPRPPTASVLGRVELPVPGLHNARNATAALVAALQVGAPFEAGADRPRPATPGVARRFQFRGEAAGVTFVDDYAHLPGKVRGRPRRGGRRRLGPGGRACSSRTATPAPRTCWPRLRRLVRRRRPGRGHRRLRRGRAAPARRHGQADRRRGARRAPPRRGSSSCRAATTSCRSWPTSSGPATSASPSAPATSPRCPTSCSPRLDGARAGGGDRVRRPLRRGRRGCSATGPGADVAARAADHLPGRRRRRPCSSRSEDEADLAALAGRGRGPPGCATLVVGRGSNLLVADARLRRPRLRASGDAFAEIDRSTAPLVTRRAAAPACRWSPGGPRPPGSPGSSGPSACPARSAARCA